jgi:hypothetical protein
MTYRLTALEHVHLITGPTLVLQAVREVFPYNPTQH